METTTALTDIYHSVEWWHAMAALVARRLDREPMDAYDLRDLYDAQVTPEEEYLVTAAHDLGGEEMYRYAVAHIMCRIIDPGRRWYAAVAAWAGRAR